MKTVINKRPRYFLIEQNLFNYIEQKTIENNSYHTKGIYKLKIDILIFFVDLIQRKTIEKRKDLVYGYVRLMAEIFQDYHKNYKRYIDFLVRIKVLKKIPYCIKGNKAYGYKIVYDTYSKKRIIIPYSPIDFIFKSKIKKGIEKQKKRADKTCKHLTKWINSDNIKFDYSSAIDFMHNSNNKDEKLYHMRYAIEYIKLDQWNYQRDGKDNRLHSNLTNLSSELRQFITYKGTSLVSLDLKTSQPFLLAGILNLIINKQYNKIERLIKTIRKTRIRNHLESSLSVMIPKSYEPIANKEVEDFIKLITDHDIYLYLADKLSEEFLKKINKPNGIFDKVYSKSKGIKINTKFDDLRDYCKKAMLEYLYCSPKSNELRTKEIRRILPNFINEFIDLIKEDNKSYFPIILQNIEAYIFLDIITKNLTKKNPDLFMLTIHDSIIIPVGYEILVEEEINNILTDTFNLKPDIHVEPWNDLKKVA